MTHPLFERRHLEALLVARTVLDPAFADDVALERLSPAAVAILDRIWTDPELAASALDAGPRDEFQDRLADRARRLTLEELAFFSRETLVILLNRLPAIGRRRAA